MRFRHVLEELFINFEPMKKPLPNHIHFVVQDDEYPLDRYDEYLFSFKQFFITRAVVPKLFLKKNEAMLIMHVAAVDLYPDLLLERSDADSVFSKPNFTGYWKQDFNLLQHARNEFKRLIVQANTGTSISSIVREWMTVEVEYIMRYGAIYRDDLENVLVSKEPDPMLLLEQMNKIGNTDTVDYLSRVRKELPDVLQSELKRLNLLTQYLS